MATHIQAQRYITLTISTHMQLEAHIRLMQPGCSSGKPGGGPARLRASTSRWRARMNLIGCSTPVLGALMICLSLQPVWPILTGDVCMHVVVLARRTRKDRLRSGRRFSPPEPRRCLCPVVYPRSEFRLCLNEQSRAEKKDRMLCGTMTKWLVGVMAC